MVSWRIFAAAVSNAGGLGLISFGGYPPDLLRTLIQRMRELTSRPFGINMILQFPVDALVDVCLEEKVPVLSFFWGDPSRFVERAHRTGAKVIDQVGSVDAAKRSAGAGVDRARASMDANKATKKIGLFMPSLPLRAQFEPSACGADDCIISAQRIAPIRLR